MEGGSDLFLYDLLHPISKEGTTSQNYLKGTEILAEDLEDTLKFQERNCEEGQRPALDSKPKAILSFSTWLATTKESVEGLQILKHGKEAEAPSQNRPNPISCLLCKFSGTPADMASHFASESHVASANRIKAPGEQSQPSSTTTADAGPSKARQTPAVERSFDSRSDTQLDQEFLCELLGRPRQEIGSASRAYHKLLPDIGLSGKRKPDEIYQMKQTDGEPKRQRWERSTVATVAAITAGS